MFRLRRNSKQNSYAVRAISAVYPHLSRDKIVDSVAYGTFVSLKHRILYTETPKPACTTIKHILRDLSQAPPLKYEIGPLHESRRDMFIHVRANVPLPSLVDLNNDTQEQVLRDSAFFRFCIVRNPYSRVISAWRNKVIQCEPGYELLYERLTGTPPPLEGKPTPSFSTFLRFLQTEQDLDACNPHWQRQAAHVLFSAIRYTHIGKLENLPETLSKLQSHLGTSVSLTLPNKNRSASDVRYSCLTQSTAELIYHMYKDDFTTFQYSADSWHAYALANKKMPATVSETKFLDELIERNLVISYLYEQCEANYRYSARRLQDLIKSFWLW